MHDADEGTYDDKNQMMTAMALKGNVIPPGNPKPWRRYSAVSSFSFAVMSDEVFDWSRFSGIRFSGYLVPLSVPVTVASKVLSDLVRFTSTEIAGRRSLGDV